MEDTAISGSSTILALPTLFPRGGRGCLERRTRVIGMRTVSAEKVIGTMNINLLLHDDDFVFDVCVMCEYDGRANGMGLSLINASLWILIPDQPFLRYID
jgi:hypothetical protein